MSHDHCYYRDPQTCAGALWQCRTCGEWYCEEHSHTTSKGMNIECVACERERLDSENA